MTLSATIDSTGCYAPTYNDIYSSLVISYQSIFGSDIYIDPDSQDGQLIGIFALAIADNNAIAIQTYNAYSPTFAIGNGLSSQVKLNGIARKLPSNSTANVLVTGIVGTVISNGTVTDTNNNTWSLPASITIPIAGSITVLATCQTLGAINAAIGTINKIGNPTYGWQSAVSTSTAAPGNPIETDYQLRIRQALSTALPAVSNVIAMQAQILNLPGVIQAIVYENNTATVQSGTSLPAHSISAVVEGGDPTAICQAIANSKPAGGAVTVGSTSIIVTSAGLPIQINYNPVGLYTMQSTVYITTLTGYTSQIGANIKQLLANYLNNTTIGQDLYLSQLYAACVGPTYNLLYMTLAPLGGTEVTSDVLMAWNMISQINVANINVVLV